MKALVREEGRRGAVHGDRAFQEPRRRGGLPALPRARADDAGRAEVSGELGGDGLRQVLSVDGVRRPRTLPAVGGALGGLGGVRDRAGRDLARGRGRDSADALIRREWAWTRHSFSRRGTYTTASTSISSTRSRQSIWGTSRRRRGAAPASSSHTSTTRA